MVLKEFSEKPSVFVRQILRKCPFADKWQVFRLYCYKLGMSAKQTREIALKWRFLQTAVRSWQKEKKKMREGEQSEEKKGIDYEELKNKNQEDWF